MWSASSPWPHASWNSTPPAPRRSTTGSLPDGAGTASSSVTARARRGAARPRSGSISSKSSKPDRAARALRSPVCMPGVAGRDALHHQARAHLVVVGEQAVGVGDLDAAVRVGVRRGDRRDRAALARARPRRRVRAARPCAASRPSRAATTSCGRGAALRASSATDLSAAARRCGPRRPRPRPPTAARPARGRRCARSRSSRRARRGCPAPRSRPETSSSARPSSKRALDERRSSTNTSAKSPPCRSACSSVERRTSVSIMRSLLGCLRPRAGMCPAAEPTAYRTSMAVKPGLAGIGDVARRRRPTPSLALRSGDVPVLGTPRVVALGRAGERRSRRRRAPAERARRSATRSSSRTSRRPPVGGKVTAEATLESVEGRRLTFRVSVSDARGLVAAGRITRVVVERDRFLERAAKAT